MKRMVLKYKEADFILKKINEKLTNHADYFDAERKWKAKLRGVEEINQELMKKMEKKED